MILSLPGPGIGVSHATDTLFPDAGVDVQSLLAKPGKDGRATARGPHVAGPFVSGEQPLAVLRDGDKLHILSPRAPSGAAGHTATELVQTLARLGLKQETRLKQIHLIADNTGVGGRDSFAQQFADALAAAGFRVSEIKAPRGRVRCDSRGKIFILPTDARISPARVGAPGWVPSDRHLNYYAGPEVQEKHRL
jgi:hypothetical protein